MSSLRRRWRAASAAAAAVAVAVAVVPSGVADAHPLGNLTVNTAMDVVVRPNGLAVTYVLDLAELPTVQARQQIDTDADGAVSAAEQNAWATTRCARLAQGISINASPLTSDAAPALAFPPGQGGLTTLRLTCAMTSPVRLGEHGTTLAITDTNETDRIGWREIVARGDRATLTSSEVPTVSPSASLTAYPSAVSSPPRQLRATVTARPGGAALASAASAPALDHVQARGADGLTQRMNRLVSGHHLSAALAALAIALAFLLGGLHSLAPGHGKTLMAATVLARRGAAARQVLTIGATVAATHTAGVLALGTVIWTSQVVAPDRVLPWLTLGSGVLLVITGLAFALQRLRGGGPVHRHGHLAHDHHDHHDHAHHDHPHHDHDHPHHDHPMARQVSRRWLVAMGVAGGLVPTPSALVVLLGAAALGRTWFGVVLVAVYGVGMAATLLAAGMVLVRLQSWLERYWFGSRWLGTTLRLAPMVTAGALMVGGVALAVRSLPSV
jgi:ABC-type nickel/cobalt efflux system permease component RcnA